MHRHFYAQPRLFTHFEEVTRPANYTALPDDWVILIADVVASTQAIEAGRYKEVNVVGASCIIAVLNAAGKIAVPYTFSGDGASLLVPDFLLTQARQALRGARRMARDSFGLDLLIAAIPIADVRAAGKDVSVAKFGASKDFAQAMFAGGGVAEAERFAKNPETRHKYEIIENTGPAGATVEDQASADFSGLECRWQGIQARGGETISLLVQVHRDAVARTQDILDSVLADISAIYGGGSEAQPVSTEQLNLCLGKHCVTAELAVRAHGRGALYKAFLAVTLRLQTWIADRAIALRVTVGGVNWGNYKTEVVANTDYRKFDDTLRMVLDSTTDQRARLELALEARRGRREVVYGVHVAKEALMTCLIFDRKSSHAHFVDGADGGYALAAQRMKAQLAE
ncbi:MAG: DUF3095 domain-containing protein [Betaproteobacteria bacterium]|nr:DUF3095 domain-containing protein [Betaproteobacteria bacterium]